MNRRVESTTMNQVTNDRERKSTPRGVVGEREESSPESQIGVVMDPPQKLELLNNVSSKMNRIESDQFNS